jgi:hypothetical protein
MLSVSPNEEFVDPPAFITPFCESDHLSNEVSNFEKHYEAQIALDNLFAHFSNDFNKCMLPDPIINRVSLYISDPHLMGNVTG